MRDIQQICVYCASSSRIAEKYFRVAERLGEILAENDIRLMFGGGALGLMGRVADTVLQHGGRAIGVIPDFMDKVELGHKGVELEVVPDMHTRKRRFFEGTDAIVTLPGGVGTLEEILEALTWKRLGLITCPMVIVNVDGYYDPLQLMLERAVQEEFMVEEHLKMWTFVNSADEVLPAIQAAPEWSQENFRFAAPRKDPF